MMIQWTEVLFTNKLQSGGDTFGSSSHTWIQVAPTVLMARGWEKCLTKLPLGMAQ